MKKWNGNSSSPAQNHMAAGQRSPGDATARQGAFRAVPVHDFRVIQTSGAVPADAAKTAMLPMPTPGTLPGQNQPPRSPDIEVPITPPAAPGTITVDESAETAPKFASDCKPARSLKSIRNITADISVKREDVSGSKGLPPECSLGEERVEPRHWRKTLFAWTAAGTYHKPIYFDDEQLERYGHTFGPVTQTTVSAVKFFATVPLVPYYMGVYPPNENIYDLGTYQPGSCSPYYVDPFPLSVRGAVNEMYLGILPAL